MVLLNPLFLWTLLGLLVPVAIHFWSKKKVKTIKIGSTQLLKELNPKQTRSVRLNQWFLLLLRMMIITLIALILAVPRIEFLKTDRSITYLIEPSLVGQEKVNTLLDTIEESQLRLLEPGFPILEDPKVKIDKAAIPDYWQLAQQMETLEADSIIVLTRGRMSGFKGMRPSVTLPVHWLVIDVDASAETPVEALLKNDQMVVKSIISDQNSVNYNDKIYTLDSDNLLIDNEQDSVFIKNKKEAVKLPLSKEKAQRILMVSNEQLSAEALYIRSALEAVSTYLNQEIQVSAVKDVQGIDVSSYEVLVWLKQDRVISFPGKTLLWEPDDLAVDLIEQGDTKDQYFLRHHLDAENSVDLKLPRQLMALLELHQQLPDDMQSLDLRAMDLQEMQVNTSDIITAKDPKQLKDMSPWLWTMLLIVLPAERILSKYKKQ